MSATATWIERASNHDANEERRYLHEGRRVFVAWSWSWLTWGLGANVGVDPYSEERGSAWLVLGPLCLEVYVTKAPR